MFIVDDILLSPMKGFMWLVRELHNAAEKEVASERDRVMRSLQSLHMQLEAGQIDEDEFDEQEAALLDRLDELDAMGDSASDDDDDDDDDDGDDEPESAIEADLTAASTSPPLPTDTTDDDQSKAAA